MRLDAEEDSGAVLNALPSRRKFLTTALALTGVGVLSPFLLGACADDASPTNSTSANPTSTGQPVAGGRLRLACAPTDTETLDPFGSTGGIADTQPNLFYERLYQFDESGVPQPFLAESATSTDGSVWTITLRSGIKFHDGTEMTSKDAVYSFKRFLDPKLATEAAGYFPNLTADGVVTTGERTFELRFDQPMADLPPALAQKTVRIVRDGLTDYSKPVGTGPFTLKSWVAGQSTEGAKFTDYWQPSQPYLDSIVLLSLEADAAVAALTAGQVDAIEQTTAASAAQLKSQGKTISSSPSGGDCYMPMAVDMAPFDDPDVRMAFRLIADRDQVVKVVYGGFGRLGNDLTSPDDPDYASDLPQRKQDIDKAKELLAKAGKSNLEVDLWTMSPYDTLATVFANQASQAGVKVNVKKVSASVFWSDKFMKVPFSTVNWNGRPLAQMLPLVTGDGVYNDTHWKDPEFAAKLQQALSEMDDAKRKALWHELQETLYNEGGYLIPAFADSLAAHVQGLHGLKQNPYFPFGGWHFNELWMES